MDNNKSNTLEQRKKAQKEFLELKKMQSGEIQPEKSESIVPTTIDGKVKNFWYHYKIHTIFLLFITVVMAIGITQCVSKEKYDARIVLYTRSSFTTEQIQIIKEKLTPYFSDSDGSGDINILVMDCSYNMSNTFDLNYANSNATKLQSTISSEGDVLLYIVDPDTKKHLNSISSAAGNFFTDIQPLPPAFYQAAESAGLSLPQNLEIGQRIVEGTLIENTPDIDRHISEAERILDIMKSQNN